MIIGRLLGEVQAGGVQNSSAVVTALLMRPSLLSIAGVVAGADLAAGASSGAQTAALQGARVVLRTTVTAEAGTTGAAAGGGQVLGGLALVLALALLIAPVTALGALVQAADETLLGALLETGVYGYVLLQGANLLADGSELLLEIVNPGIIGGVVLPCLGALPDSLIILVSGLGVPREMAQEQVAVGMGTLAGSTIMLLSVVWGGSLLVGRCDLGTSGEAINRTLTRGWDLRRTGVTTDTDVRRGAGIMTASVLLFGIVQVPAALGHAADPNVALLGCVACLLSLVAYCTYQVLSPELQKRKIDAARKKRFRMFALSRLASRTQERKLGPLLGVGGQVDRTVCDSIFDEFDRDRSGFIQGTEVQGLLAALDLMDGQRSDAAAQEEFDMWLREFDINRDQVISRDEFANAIGRWVGERFGTPSRMALRPLMDSATANSMIITLDDRDYQQLQETAAGLNAEEEAEVADDIEAQGSEEGPVTTRDIAIQSTVRMAMGIALCAVFSDPLVDALTHVSAATGVPPFFIAFVLTPLASNASELVSSLKFAARRRRRSISLTFSQVYGAVTVNNTLVLGLFLLVVYLQRLEWVFSAEVTTMALATLLVGAVGVGRTTFASAWALPSLALYPASLALVWVLNHFVGWQ